MVLPTSPSGVDKNAAHWISTGVFGNLAMARLRTPVPWLKLTPGLIRRIFTRRRTPLGLPSYVDMDVSWVLAIIGYLSRK